MVCSVNAQLPLAGQVDLELQQEDSVAWGQRRWQMALGLQQVDSARVRRRVVSGQNQRQEALVQPQEVHLVQRSQRVVDLAVDLVLRRQEL